ncbi:MAG: helix-turn-helix transcriptional regulator [Acidimicrobiaceae bacterium]|nr:helix-turn-helix transcriptional regulator [Acidimicrobiaceae bacterium]
MKFRNVIATPEDPVERWGAEGIHAAIERGSLRYWRRIVAAIEDDPWGKVSREVEEALASPRPYGASELIARSVEHVRARAQEADRETVAAEVRELIELSGLSRREFASRIGTSASRLSTYESGKVVPSAALMVRMRRVVHKSQSSGIPVR